MIISLSVLLMCTVVAVDRITETTHPQLLTGVPNSFTSKALLRGLDKVPSNVAFTQCGDWNNHCVEFGYPV